MSKLEGFVQQQSVNRASDGTMKGVRMTRDGAVLQIPWIQALCLEGRVFGASYGSGSLTFTGPGTFQAAGAIDEDAFDYHHTIPATVAVIPVYYAPVFELVGTVEIVSNLLVYGISGTIAGGAAITPYNMRPAAGIDSLCTIVGLTNGGGTTITIQGCVYMSGATMMSNTTTTGANVLPAFSVDTAGYAPVIEGSRQLAGFHSGQADTGYVVSNYIELPVAMVS